MALGDWKSHAFKRLVVMSRDSFLKAFAKESIKYRDGLETFSVPIHTPKRIHELALAYPTLVVRGRASFFLSEGHTQGKNYSFSFLHLLIKVSFQAFSSQKYKAKFKEQPITKRR